MLSTAVGDRATQILEVNADLYVYTCSQLADFVVSSGIGFSVGVVASVLLFRREYHKRDPSRCFGPICRARIMTTTTTTTTTTREGNDVTNPVG
jgi:hypothetical protein